MFIAFEGLDGSGSSTQSRLLKEKLEKKGMPVTLTKEPTADEPIGALIRSALQKKWSCSPEALQLLFTADRAEHLKNIILPALRKDSAVITDRYFFSTLAYGALAVADWNWLKDLSRLFPVPDFTFLLKLDPAVCIQRIRGRGQAFELFEEQQKLEKIWRNYEKIANEYPNIHIIDASQTIAVVADAIWEIASTAP